jgi:hypothetical protein
MLVTYSSASILFNGFSQTGTEMLVAFGCVCNFGLCIQIYVI